MKQTHVSWVKHGLVLLGWLPAQLYRRRGFVRSCMRFPWLVLVWEEMEVAGHHSQDSLRENAWAQTSRTLLGRGHAVMHARYRPMWNLDAH